MANIISNFKLFLCLTILTFSQSAVAQTEQLPDYSALSTEELTAMHEAGDMHATFSLGYNYFFEDDVTIKENVTDVEAGLNFLEQAHDQGHIYAHSSLNLIYINGLFGQSVNIDKANTYSLEGALRGSATGKANYGIQNLNRSDKQNATKARSFLIDLVTDEKFAGIANELLTEVNYFGNDVFEADYESARLFAENCVIVGKSEGRCEFLLARDFQSGWGGAKDIDRSAALFLKGAEAGNPNAMWNVGMNALNGVGREKNETAAFEWVKKSAEDDYVWGMISLGVMYAIGQGTEINYDKAYASYDRAAQHGSAHAVRSMAAMHCSGEGREENAEICAAGLILAAEHDDTEAPRLLQMFFDIKPDDLESFKQETINSFQYWKETYPWLSSD